MTLTVPRRFATFVVAGLAVTLTLIVLATSSGPVDFVSRPGAAPGPGPTASNRPATAVTIAPQTRSTDLPPALTGIELPPLVALLIQLVLYAVVVMVLLILLRAAWRAAPRWRVRHEEQPAFDPLPQIPDELTESAPSRMALLAEGDARNAIVACWLSLEDAAGAVGLPRRAAETASEYTTRVLSRWAVDRPSLDGLCQLYREARFSRHAFTEAHRSAAVDRLRRLHLDLELVAAAQAAERAEAGATAAPDTARRGAAGTDGRPR